MKYCLLTANAFFILFFSGFSQNLNCPPNIDFELGNFSNWDCFTGNTSYSGTTNYITLVSSPPTASRHELMTNAATIDPYGGFPTVCPYGGTSSVKLGNQNSGNQAEGIAYTFQIPPSADTFSLTYYYAVVFEVPSHLPHQQPRFRVSAYDVLTGNVINCASYDYVSSGAIPGFLNSTLNSSVKYKAWTPASIDFSGLAGRQVRLEFKTADCTEGGHFGYAYLDVATGCGGVIAAGAYCVSTNSVTLNAPFGFQTYNWYDNTYSTLIGTTRTVTLSPPPPLNSLFHVDMIPYPGYGCRDTAHAVLTVLPVPDTPTAVTNIYYCQLDPPATISATAVLGNELLWYTSPTAGIPSTVAPTPNTNTTGIFNYYVTQKKLFGCESERKRITVTISPTPAVSFTVNNIRQCENGNSFLCTSTSTNLSAGVVYEWSFGDGTTSNLPVATHIYSSSGTYNVTLKVSNSPSCFRLAPPKQVLVVPKPLADFTYPPIICENQTLIALQNSSSVPGGFSTISNSWWQIDGNIVTTTNPNTFLNNAGILPVKLVAYTVEGCRSDTLKRNLLIHYSPIPKFSIGPLLCNNEIINFGDQSVMPVDSSNDKIITWSWYYDNVLSSNIPSPSAMFTTGIHTVKLVVESDKGCNAKFADSTFTIYSKPNISLSISDSCALRNIVFTATNSASSPAVNKWYWDFGTGLTERNAVQNKSFSQEGSNPITLIGETFNNCKDTLIHPYTIYRNRSKALRDTIVATDEIVQLNTADTLNMLSYKWSPNTGLNDISISNPLATYEKDIQYELNTLTIQGCDSYSKILVRRYDGPEIYVPNAFTPNKDGNNDLLRAFPAGIKSFEYFSIYNRNGQLVFLTKNHYAGWDGNFKGVKLDAGNYVWAARAIDYRGKVLFRKGNVLLLR